MELVEGAGLVDGVLEIVEEGGDDLVNSGHSLELGLLDVSEITGELDFVHAGQAVALTVQETGSERRDLAVLTMQPKYMLSRSKSLVAL